ncbi:MAG: hypothetical protein ACK5H1_04970 [Tenacibaculum sp.]
MNQKRAENLLYKAGQLIDSDKIIQNNCSFLVEPSFYNYLKSKKHLEMVLKCSPDYHVAYANYAYLLIDMNLCDEMISFDKVSLKKRYPIRLPFTAKRHRHMN